MKFLNLKPRHVVCTPLHSGKKIIALMFLINKIGEHGYFSSNDQKILESVSSQIARGIETYRLKEEKMKVYVKRRR